MDISRMIEAWAVLRNEYAAEAHKRGSELGEAIHTQTVTEKHLNALDNIELRVWHAECSLRALKNVVEGRDPCVPLEVCFVCAQCRDDGKTR